MGIWYLSLLIGYFLTLMALGLAQRYFEHPILKRSGNYLNWGFVFLAFGSFLYYSLEVAYFQHTGNMMLGYIDRDELTWRTPLDALITVSIFWAIFSYYRWSKAGEFKRPLLDIGFYTSVVVLYFVLKMANAQSWKVIAA